MLGVERSPSVVMRRSCIKNYKSSLPPLAVLQMGQCVVRHKDDRNDYYGLGMFSDNRFIVRRFVGPRTQTLCYIVIYIYNIIHFTRLTSVEK